MQEVLLSDTDDRGVTTLTLNRPERRNALDGGLVAALLAELERLQDEAVSHVVVLTGSGKSFCSGADLKWVKQVVAQGDVPNRRDARQLARLMQSLNTCAKPTLACVNGPAFGGGIGLIACCDVVVADSSAQFIFTEVQLGLIAAIVLPYLLAAIGEHNARRYLISAEPFGCEQAMAMGLVHETVPAKALNEAVEAKLSLLLRGVPGAQYATKRLIKRLRPLSPEIITETAELFAKMRASSSGQAGIEAFLSRHNAGQRK